MRLSSEQMSAIMDKVNGRASLASMRDHPQEKQKRDRKYNNIVVDTKDGRFDSKAEYRRFEYLDMLQKAGEIKDLKKQVPFELIPAQVAPDGKKIRPTVYVADFTYIDKDGKFVVEDPKGYASPEWRIKQKLMLQVHGIWVKEIRS